MHSATLVLIPGLMCDRTVWSDVLPHLGDWAPRATVPDHGLCDSLSGMAQQILDTTTGPLALVGHSMGGRIAMEMVRMAPQRVCHLTLMDTGHLPRPAGPEGEAEAAKRHALLEIAEQQGVAAMKERGGSIVNMASVSSWLPIEGYAGYSASKAAVAALTRATALYCRKNGHAIRVNSLHPDGIYTPMMQATAPGVPAHYLMFDPKANPKGRATLPENIAKVLLFLASDDSQAISGAEIRADSAILGMGL